MSNAHELHARDRKTGRLVSAIARSGQRHGLSNAEILSLLRAAPEGWWATVAQQAQCRPPSDKTRTLVIERFEQMGGA